MTHNKFILICFFLLSMSSLCAQSISFNFPHFKNQEWYMTAFRGENRDTIMKGRLDEAGFGKIILSPEYKKYRGMSQWLLVDGGGLDIIISGSENISVSSNEISPTPEHIKIEGSEENSYLSDRYARQRDILTKLDAMHIITNIYKETDVLYPTFLEETKKQEQFYSLLQQEAQASPLYAAGFAQIVDVTRGLPSQISQNSQDINDSIKSFIVQKMDISFLYTSGYWLGVLNQWLDWYSMNPYKETSLLEDYQSIKERIGDAEVLKAFEESVYKLLDSKNRLDLILLLKQTKAPKITSVASNQAKTIIVFHQTGCGNCTVEMDKLVNFYPILREKGYRVVSISADSDKNIFEQTTASYPWADKYYDVRGGVGPDFTNYGVVGTPTFFLIDENELIKGIYARVEDIKL